ncbi:uncharacterized protein LOC120305049 [Crotalus tigris]|uniref:uncharacterized protein LOC120305049 n=1 Tax=Crotalus tigris TaxID=88082 RepID=UPI00192F7FE7|nr:uncharacterized protein LOC120305049 [Crotalus tigris]
MSSCSGAAVDSSPISEGTHQCFQSEGSSSVVGIELPSMVDLSSAVKGHRVHGTSQSHHHHRCQSIRLESASPVSLGPGSLVSGGFEKQYQLAGAQSHSSGPTAFQQHDSGGSLGCFSLAEATVVRGPDGALHLISMEDPGRSYFPHPRGTPAPGPAVAPTNRLALERRALSLDSYSLRMIAVIQQSRHPSMNRVYDATWRSFCTWCAGHRVELSGVSVPVVLEFLMDGLDKGLSPNTIHRQVAALTTVLTCDNATPLTHHPLVRSFLKGATNARPPTVHRYPSWDLHQVLQALIAPPFEPMETCPLDLLSMKVAFLVAVTSARRISELAAFSVREDLCIFFSDRVVLRLDPSFIPKV